MHRIKININLLANNNFSKELVIIVKRSTHNNSSSSLMYSFLMSKTNNSNNNKLKKKMKYIIDNNIKFPLINSNELVKCYDNSELLESCDMKSVLSRQILSKKLPSNDNIVGITKYKCKHGHPQAFINNIITDTKVSSGFIRLSCPHLVKEIDKIENSLMIKFNDEIKNNVELQNNYHKINDFYKKMKNQLLNTKIIQDFLLHYLGSVDRYNNFMNSGIIGVSTINDVKCLHAHTADYLLRGNNKIGEMTLNSLKDNGVDINGCDNCHEQCSIQHNINDSSWFYIPLKNKSGLRLSKFNKYNNKNKNVIKD